MFQAVSDAYFLISEKDNLDDSEMGLLRNSKNIVDFSYQKTYGTLRKVFPPPIEFILLAAPEVFITQFRVIVKECLENLHNILNSAHIAELSEDASPPDCRTYPSSPNTFRFRRGSSGFEERFENPGTKSDHLHRKMD